MKCDSPFIYVIFLPFFKLMIYRNTTFEICLGIHEHHEHHQFQMTLIVIDIFFKGLRANVKKI